MRSLPKASDSVSISLSVISFLIDRAECFRSQLTLENDEKSPNLQGKGSVLSSKSGGYFPGKACGGDLETNGWSSATRVNEDSRDENSD